MIEEPTDEWLVTQYLADPGSPDGRGQVDELFRRYHTRVGLWCLRITGDREQAADLAQEVFLQAFKSLPRFRGDSKFSTWLYSIARHHCFHFIRSAARAPEFDAEAELTDVVDEAADPLDELEQTARREDAARLLAESLDETERTVFMLHFGEGVPLPAIGRLLQLENPSGAKAHVVSAKRKLSRAVVRWKAQQAHRATGFTAADEAGKGAERRDFQ